MDSSSVFCPYNGGPAILDKVDMVDGEVPIVDKRHRCELMVTTKGPSSKHEFRHSYLTKCGRFLFLTQVWSRKNSKAKVLAFGKCSTQSIGKIFPIIEWKLDINPTGLHVSPNEKYMVIFEEPTAFDCRETVFDLYKLNLQGLIPKLMKVDSVIIDSLWANHVSLTDTHLNVQYCDYDDANIRILRVYEINERFSLSSEKKGIKDGLKCGLFVFSVEDNGLFVHLSNLRTGKVRKRIIDKYWSGFVGDMQTIQIYPSHLQGASGDLYAITSPGAMFDSKIYITQMEGNDMKVIKTIFLEDIVEEIFNEYFDDIVIDEDEYEESMITNIEVNPYTCNCYVMIVDNHLLDSDERRHHLFCFNPFSSGHRHIIEVSDLVFFRSRLTVNWLSNEILISDTQGKIVGYQMPLPILSLQEISKRAVYSLYKSQEIQELDIPRYLKEYLLS